MIDNYKLTEQHSYVYLQVRTQNCLMMTAFTSRKSKTTHRYITLKRLSNQYSRWVEEKKNSELWPPLTICDKYFWLLLGAALLQRSPPLISQRSESPNKLLSDNLAFMLFIWYLGLYDTNESVCSTIIIVHAYVIIVVLFFFKLFKSCFCVLHTFFSALHLWQLIYWSLF